MKPTYPKQSALPARRASGGSGSLGAPAQADAFDAIVQTQKEAAPALRIMEIRQGYPAHVIADISRHFNLPKQTVNAVLGVPDSTAQRLIKEYRSLDSAASERVARIAAILLEASDVIGSRDGAKQWLTTKNLALGNQTPFSMLDTDQGALEVRRILMAIAYGGVV